MQPKISIIVACDENRGIGKANELLWHISGDLKRFKALTTGHVIIMGRKTHQSIGRTLPDRLNIVISSSSEYKPFEGSVLVASLEQALNLARKSEREEIFIIGGGQIYAEAINFADKIYLTLVHDKFDADTFFPDYSAFNKIISETPGESGDLKYTYFELEK